MAFYMQLGTHNKQVSENISTDLQSKPSSSRGFTLVEVMIVVAIIGLLAAIALPNLLRSQQRAQAKACVNNLRQIDSAKQQWAIETGKSEASLPVQADIDPFFRSFVMPGCPMNGTYNLNQVSVPPDCNPYAAVGHILN